MIPEDNCPGDERFAANREDRFSISDWHLIEILYFQELPQEISLANKPAVFLYSILRGSNFRSEEWTPGSVSDR